jgi:secreted trypsin-like serine protease
VENYGFFYSQNDILNDIFIHDYERMTKRKKERIRRRRSKTTQKNPNKTKTTITITKTTTTTTKQHVQQEHSEEQRAPFFRPIKAK